VLLECHIIIEAGDNVFVFDARNKYTFDNSLFEKLDDDRYFKINFLGQNSVEGEDAENNRERLLDLIHTDDNIRKFGNVQIAPMVLNNAAEIDFKSYVKDIFWENNIRYELEGKETAVFFLVE
jgi:hypothetical protein